jgi:hypothetical protein
VRTLPQKTAAAERRRERRLQFLDISFTVYCGRQYSAHLETVITREARALRMTPTVLQAFRAAGYADPHKTPDRFLGVETQAAGEEGADPEGQGRTLPAKPHAHARAQPRTLAATRLGVPEHLGTDRDLRCHPGSDAAADEWCETLHPALPFDEALAE